MESTEYSTPEELATAVIKVVAEELGKRKTYAIRPKLAPIAYGPYWSQKDAEKAWQEEIGPLLGCEAGLLRVYGWEHREPDLVVGICACGHWKDQHVMKQKKMELIGPFDCGICGCKQFSTKKETDNE